MKTSVRNHLLITAALGLWCSVGQAADYQTTVTGYGPLGYWRFNETAPSPALNKVSNAGSLASAADGYALNVTKGEAGIVGNSLKLVNLGGTVNCSSRVDVPYSSPLNPGVFSVEIWIKPSTYAGTDDTGTCIMTSLNSNGFNSANRQGWVMYMGNTGRLQFWLGLNSGYPIPRRREKKRFLTLRSLPPSISAIGLNISILSCDDRQKLLAGETVN